MIAITFILATTTLLILSKRLIENFEINDQIESLKGNHFNITRHKSLNYYSNGHLINGSLIQYYSKTLKLHSELVINSNIIYRNYYDLLDEIDLSGNLQLTKNAKC